LDEAREHHGLRPEGEGRWMVIALWTDNTNSAVSALVAKGAPLLSWRYWLSRRSQRAYISWDKMIRLLQHYPLPQPRIRFVPGT